jgi:hypothetical protein
MYLVSLDATNNLWVVRGCCDTGGGPKAEARVTLPPPVHRALVDRRGHVWTIDEQNRAVTKYLPFVGGAALPVVFVANYGAIPASPARAHHAAIDARGDLWIANGALLERVDGATGQVQTIGDRRLGDAQMVLAHSNGAIYVGRRVPGTTTRVTRLTPVGAQWIEDVIHDLPDDDFLGLVQAPDDSVWLTLSGGTIRAITPQPGATVLFDSRSNDNAGPLLALPAAGTGGEYEVWVTSRITNAVTRATFAQGALTQRERFVFADAVSTIGADGYGRVWLVLANGDVFHTRDAWPATLGELVQRWRIATTTVGIWGDPTGYHRAASADRAADDDGDGFTNWSEVLSGSHPFWPRITPASSSTSRLLVTSPAPIGTAVAFFLHGKPGYAYAVLAGAPAPAPIAIPGIGGLLELDPTQPIQIALGGPGSGPFGIPPSGTVQLATGIPNDPTLVGRAIPFQAFTALGLTDPGLSNLAVLSITR